MQNSCDTAQERFIVSFSEYVYAVIEEASDRARGSIRGIEDYLRLTRLTAGPYPCFFPIEMDLDIPDEVMAHSSMEIIRSLAAESLVLGNVNDVNFSQRSDVSLTDNSGSILVQHRTRIWTRRS